MKPVVKKSAGLVFFVLLVLGLAAVSVADEESKDAKRARLKESRRLLKSARALIGEGAYDPALASLDSVLAIDSANADAFYQKGLTKGYMGDTAGAVQTLTDGVRLAPQSSRLKLLLARFNIISGSDDRAEPLIDAVLQIKLREAKALYLKGLVLLHRGDTTLALESFGRALEISLPEAEQL